MANKRGGRARYGAIPGYTITGRTTTREGPPWLAVRFPAPLKQCDLNAYASADLLGFGQIGHGHVDGVPEALMHGVFNGEDA